MALTKTCSDALGHGFMGYMSPTVLPFLLDGGLFWIVLDLLTVSTPPLPLYGFGVPGSFETNKMSDRLFLL